MKYAVLILTFFSTVSGFAQDQLFKKDNSKTEIRVLEISADEIKYKLFNYQDGPTITVLKSEVTLIIYQDGRHQTFQAQEPQPQQPVLLAGLGYRSDDYLSNDPKNYMYSNYGNYTTGFPFEFPFNKFPINTFKINLSLGYRF